MGAEVNPSRVTIISSERSWIEGEAVQQLKRAAQLAGACMAVGMPDLHPGRGYPVGAAIVTESVVYPHLVGNDIGCGMGLWQSTLKVRKVKTDQLLKRLRGLEGPWEGDLADWILRCGIPATHYDSALGTIGGGNHFAELQAVDRVEDPVLAEALGLDEQQVFLLVHSGSRGLGESILRAHAERDGTNGLPEGSDACREYLEQHDLAVNWAQANRGLIARRFFEALGTEGRSVLDITHNSVSSKVIDSRPYWIHRKGAAPSDAGPVVIPGSRGTYTFVLAAKGDHRATAYSLAHGAGRKWNRTFAKERLRTRFTPEVLSQTKIGSRVICDDRDLLFEEAPDAYKNIEDVVKDMEDFGLVKTIARMRPLVTYKVRHS